MSNPFEVTSYSEGAAGAQTLRLRRVGVLSVGMFGGAAGVIMGLVVGAFFLLLTMVGIGAGGGQNVGAPLAGGVFMVVLLPVFYGIGGFIGGVINAIVYNIVAGMSGGIEMAFSQDNT